MIVQIWNIIASAFTGLYLQLERIFVRNDMYLQYLAVFVFICMCTFVIYPIFRRSKDD